MKVDLGCGARRKSGSVGVDFVAGEGVDHVVDMMREPLPFADDTIDEVFSSHFLEHVAEPGRILNEIVRIGKPGTQVEIWTPYAHSNLAFLPGHVNYLSETLWEHFCMEYPELWFKDVSGVLRLDEFHYVVSRAVVTSLGEIPLWFALRHFQNVVIEWKVSLTVLKGPEYRDKGAFKRSVRPPRCVFGHDRADARPLPAPPLFWKLEN